MTRGGMLRVTYRCLAWAVPATARERVGADLIETLVADVQAAPWPAAPGRFFANAVDLVRAGLAERRAGTGPGDRTGPPRRVDPVESLSRLWRDVVVAVRGFLKAPGFTAVAVLSLALGIGLNSAIFTVVNAVLLRPVPGRAPAELVAIFSATDESAHSSMSYPDFADLAARATTLDGLMAHSLMFAGIDRGDRTDIVTGEIVSPNYFEVLGVPLAAGRAFAPGSERADAAPTAIISHRLWQRDFGGSRDALGRTLTILGRPYTVIGVAPASFGGLAAGMSADLWLPAGAIGDVEPVGAIDVVASPTGATRNEQRGQRYLFLTGRLKPGVGVDEARANLNAVMAALEREFPATNAHRRLTVMPASDVRLLPGLDALLDTSAVVLMAAVGLVLLVACANLAGLLLARSTARAKEMAVRVAIGAGRWHIVQQLVVESLLLAVAGGVLGLLLAAWLVKVVSALPLPMPVSVTFDLAPDTRVLLFTCALSLATGLAFGLLPALRASRPNLVPALKGDAELTRTRRWPLRSVLVGAEMALCTVLLVLAALLLRSFLAASRADIRFDAAHAAYAGINVAKQFPDAAGRARFLDEAERRLAALPGVTAVARTDRLPFALTGNVAAVTIAGVQGPLRDGAFSVDVTNVSAGYFTTLGIPIVVGRAFDARDRGPQSMRAIIVNQTAARLFWPGRDPLGARLKVRGDAEWTVVGVSADHPVRAVGERPRPFVHFAIDQLSPGFVNLVARSDGSAVALASAMRRELLSLEPRLAFMGMEPVSKMADITLVPARAATWLIGAFGALALVLALVGLYGVVSFTVARETRNIGIRMALGATTGRILSDVLSASLRIAGAGALAGLGVAALAAQAIAGFLVGVTAFDVVSYAGAIALLLAAALAASLVPARKASRTNPIVAIRS